MLRVSYFGWLVEGILLVRRGRVDTIRRGETSGGIKRVWRRYRYMKEKENCPMVPEEREREKERRERWRAYRGK